MDKVSDAAFRVMCDMWGVDAAVKAVKRMGMMVPTEQIAIEKEKEAVMQERWNSIFKPKEDA